MAKLRKFSEGNRFGLSHGIFTTGNLSNIIKLPILTLDGIKINIELFNNSINKQYEYYYVGYSKTSGVIVGDVEIGSLFSYEMAHHSEKRRKNTSWNLNLQSGLFYSSFWSFHFEIEQTSKFR